MNKISAENAIRIAKGALLASLVAVGSFFGMTFGPKPTPPVVPKVVDDEKLLEAKFKVELQRSLESQHAATMDAIEAQSEVLARIETSIKDALAKQAKQTQARQDVVQVKTIPVRRDSARWTVKGRRDYSREFIEEHLAMEHGISGEGYTFEELQIMHDNIHNGYDAMGTAVQNVVQSVTPTVIYHSPVQFCPTGRCP